MLNKGFKGKKLLKRIDKKKQTPIKFDDFISIRAMKLSILAHPKARLLLAHGEPEVSIFWTDQETGIDCRCRPDFIHANHILVDLKSTTDASPNGFAKSIANFRYHVQDAYYSEGYSQATGMYPRGFVFIAVEKESPYAVGVYSLDEDSKSEGREQFFEDLKKYKQAKETGVYPAYSDQIETLRLPNWAFTKGYYE